MIFVTLTAITTTATPVAERRTAKTTKATTTEAETPPTRIPETPPKTKPETPPTIITEAPPTTKPETTPGTVTEPRSAATSPLPGPTVPNSLKCQMKNVTRTIQYRISGCDFSSVYEVNFGVCTGYCFSESSFSIGLRYRGSFDDNEDDDDEHDDHDHEDHGRRHRRMGYKSPWDGYQRYYRGYIKRERKQQCMCCRPRQSKAMLVPFRAVNNKNIKRTLLVTAPVGCECQPVGCTWTF